VWFYTEYHQWDSGSWKPPVTGEYLDAVAASKP
jgi:hypothetical protein